MVERRTKQGAPEGLYFTKPSGSLQFIGSGCTILDQVLGGGWPLGRMSNVIGDNSSGKTLLAIEACANFAAKFQKGNIWYRETEAAFDEGYAEALGLPLDRVDFGDKQWSTIEEIFDDLSACLKKKHPGLYIIDSFDALSDKEELEREIDEGSYSLTKQKKLHRLFRELVRDLSACNVHLMIISQTRAKIGVTFGDRTTRSGGAALDFYASQHLKLAKLGQIKKKLRGLDNTIGVGIRAKCTKNKIGLPHRECDFDIRFGFGINDAACSLEFLLKTGKTKAVDLSIERAKALLPFLKDLDRNAYAEWVGPLDEAVRQVWPAIQTELLPSWRKY